MIRRILILSMVAFGLMAYAQDRNQIYTVKVNELTYTTPEGNHSAGEVIGTVIETLSGSATNHKHPELVPGITGNVKTALSNVLRLAVVNDDAQFEVSGNIDKITTNIQVETIERKDSKGKKVVDTYNDYRAEIGSTLTLTDLASGQQWT